MSEKRSSFCGVIPPLWWWLLTLLGLALLAYFMISTQQQPIEDNVANNVKQDLAAANIDWAEVETTNRGRDVLLQGVAPDADKRQEAVEIAQAAEGVRVVEDQFDTAKADIALVDEGDAAALENAQAPALSADTSDKAAPLEPSENDASPEATEFKGVEMSLQPNGNLVLSGNVSQAEDVDVLVAAAEKRVGKEAVINELSVSGAGESPQWLKASEALVTAIPDTEGRLKVGDGRVAVSGLIEEDVQRFDVMGKVDAALSDSNMVLTDNLQVAGAETAGETSTETDTTLTDTASETEKSTTATEDSTTSTSEDAIEIADDAEQTSADTSELAIADMDDVTDAATQTAEADSAADKDDATDTTDAATQTAESDSAADMDDVTDTTDAVTQTAEADGAADTDDATDTTGAATQTAEADGAADTDDATDTTNVVTQTAETDGVADTDDATDTTDAAAQTADSDSAADTDDATDTAPQTTEADTEQKAAVTQQPASGGINIVGLETPEEEAANSCQDRFNKITDSEQILFASSKAELQSDSLQILNKVATVILECRDVLAERGVEIAGYTDSTGDAAYNQMLSQQRADAVREYLVGSGVEGGLLETKGYGEADPIAPNNTAAGRAKNRRITFKIKQQ